MEVPISQIKIINPRERDPAKFRENVDSIRRVGLKRPIVLNTRFLKETGFYELVCGQGRIEACKQLDYEKIPSLLIDVDRPTGLLMSIAENNVRRTPSPLWFANVIKGLHESGMNNHEIGNILGCDPSTVSEYLNLINQGKEALIRAVENNKISISVALEIARTPEAELQELLVNGAEQKMFTLADMPMVRKIINQHIHHVNKPRSNTEKAPRNETYTIDILRNEIRRTLDKQKEFIRKSQRVENRLMLLSEEFRRLNQDPNWIELLMNEGLTDYPKLKGDIVEGLFSFMLEEV
jgi:ParB family chromosome partitioning protein